MSETTTTTELVLKGEIGRIPLSVTGVVQNGKLSEVSGCVSVDASLDALLVDLGSNFENAGQSISDLLDGKLPKVNLERVAFGYNFAQSSAQLTATMTVAKSRCHFIVLKKGGKAAGESGGQTDGMVVGFDLESDQAIGNNFLTGLIGEISFGRLGLYYAGTDFPALPLLPSDACRDAASLPAPGERAGQPTVRSFRKGINFSVSMRIGGIDLLDLLGETKGKEADQGRLKAERRLIEMRGPALPAATGAPLAKASTHWIKADKTIGPVTVRRIGLRYDAPRIGIALDAGLQLACLTFTLEGLGVSYPINAFTTDPRRIWDDLRFTLDGASVTFQRGPLTISGGLLKVNDSPLQLDGTLLVKTAVFAVAAIGSYTTIKGEASFFAFAALQKELGGPPFFFVTGLALGLGINRALKLPAINEVHNFPLVKAATDPDYLGAKLDLRDVSRKIADYIYPSLGDYWLAAGLKFSSFNQIDAFALLSVSFGTRFEIGLLGLATLRVPKQLPVGPVVPAIACVEMALKVSFTPESGVLSCEARLTENSFLLMKEFTLRGGFAFYCWFAKEHAGDFVVSIGGYHPRFSLPSHYPKPELVAFHCVLGGVTIQGGCYFALCPSAIMAGGGLSIVYESGGIRAWFVAYADFLIQWRPLFYDVAVVVSIGVAVDLRGLLGRIHLSAQVGASVSLYGPPLGGTARVSLYIISFTVAFGEAKRLPPPLVWESQNPEKSFAASFLPNPDVVRISITDGLLREGRDEKGGRRFVNPHNLSMECRCQVPLTSAIFNGKEVPAPTDQIPSQPGVRPMGKAAFYSGLTVTLQPKNDPSGLVAKYLEAYVDLALVRKSVPLALWGKDPLDTRTPPKEQMIDNAAVGIEIRTKAGPRTWETPVLSLKVLAYDRVTKTVPLFSVRPRQALLAFGDKTLSNTVEEPDVAAKRESIVAKLRQTGRAVIAPEEIRLSQLEKGAQYIFQAMPAMARAGQYPPRGYLET